MLAKWRYFAEQRARIEPDADWTAFIESRELRGCKCRFIEPREVVARLESGDRVAALHADDERNTRCELCLEDAYSPWKTRVQTQCAQMDGVAVTPDGANAVHHLTGRDPEPAAAVAVDRNESPNDPAPVAPRESGKLYYRLFMNRMCTAQVEPGPVAVGTGDLMAVPLGSAALVVRSPCGGTIEVYFGKEPQPRVTEVFGKNQPLRLQFRKP